MSQSPDFLSLQMIFPSSFLQWSEKVLMEKEEEVLLCAHAAAPRKLRLILQA